MQNLLENLLRKSNILKNTEALTAFASDGVQYLAFGDIFLEDLRKYREEKLAIVGMQAVFPLWQHPTAELAREFIDLGFKAIVVCVDEQYLGKDYVGREYDASFLADLPREVDPCGERGEFHTFVYDGPIFQWPVNFAKGEVVYRKYIPPPRKADEHGDYPSEDATVPETGFWYCDLIEDID